MTRAERPEDSGFSGMIHATSVAIGGHAVLITGESGSGKSDLALRLIDRGAILISDDYTRLGRSGDRVQASTSPNIAGQIEVRSLGIVTLPHLETAPAALVIYLVSSREDPPERHPFTLPTRRLCGVDLPVLCLCGLEASAPLKVELALREQTGTLFPAGVA